MGRHREAMAARMTRAPLAEVRTPDWTWLFRSWHETTRLTAWRCTSCGWGFAYTPDDVGGVRCVICRPAEPYAHHEKVGRLAYVDTAEGQDPDWSQWMRTVSVDGHSVPLPAVVIADDENRRVTVVNADYPWRSPRSTFPERVTVQLEASALPFPPARSERELPSLPGSVEGAADPACGACKGDGWVCEDHPARSWGTADPGDCPCGGAGAPCPCTGLDGPA